MRATAPHGPSRHGRRARGGGAAPRRALLGLSIVAAVSAPAAAAQASPSPSRQTAVVAAYRVAARAHAAAELLVAGQGAAARTQLDEARQGPLLRAGDARHADQAALARLQRAVSAGDAPAARAAAGATLRAAATLAARNGQADAAPVVAALVRDAGAEGREAATAPADQATEPKAYARGLVAVAGSLAARSGLGATASDAVQALASTLRGPADAAAVRTATATALAALGAPPSRASAERAFAAIDQDLGAAVARYRQGDAAGAERALVDAYLDNFEGLEPALREADARLEQRLEATLARGLRDLLKRGVAPSAFESAVAQARSELAKAQEALR